MKKVGVNGKLFQVPVDSQWGPTTVNALKKFQTLEKINPDGIPGPDTYTALHKLGLSSVVWDDDISSGLDAMNQAYIYYKLGGSEKILKDIEYYNEIDCKSMSEIHKIFKKFI